MKVFKYRDYKHYVEAQTRTNMCKENWVYVRDEIIKIICEYKPDATNVLCHGTRSAAEQKFFKKYLKNAFVIGTEISSTATKYPMTVQWDFSFPKDEWINKFDIVYSNAFDHTICPVKTLCTWRDQLNNSGKLFLEYAQSRSREPLSGTETDPLSATNDEVKQFIDESKMKIVDEIRNKNIKHGGIIFVCSKN